MHQPSYVKRAGDSVTNLPNENQLETNFARFDTCKSAELSHYADNTDFYPMQLTITIYRFRARIMPKSQPIMTHAIHVTVHQILGISALPNRQFSDKNFDSI